MLKEELILNKLQIRYQKDKELQNWFLSFIQKPTISLRTVEWLASSYSKRNNVSYYVKRQDGTRFLFHLHPSYKTQIKAYTRTNFDPFKRKKSITIHLPSFQTSPQPGDTNITTLSQLNFFRWAFENGVIDYAIKNLEVIQRDIETRERRSNTAKEQVIVSGNTTPSKKTTTDSKKREKTSVKKSSKSVPTPQKGISIPIPRGVSNMTLSFR